VDSADLICSRKIGDGPRNPKNPVEAPRRKAHRRGGIGQELASRMVGRGNLVEQLSIRLGIRPHAVSVVAP
jgi:hypothetical protein